jgi:peptide/nickel transport system substrate-binding protein
MARRRTAVGGGLVLVCVCLAIFAVGVGLRLPCRDVCGSDLGRLYESRGIDRDRLPFVDRPLEYPPLVGVVMYVAGVPGDGSPRVSFVFNALVLAALAALVTWLLWRAYGARAKRWLIAPPLIFEGLINWDLLAVAPATAGILIWVRGGAFWAGALLGVGAVAKLFPALYVVMLAASCVPGAQWRRAAEVVLGALVATAVIVVPVVLVAPNVVSHLVDFQGARAPTRGTVLFYVVRDPALHPWISHDMLAPVGNVVSAGLTAIGIAVLATWVARGRLEALPASALGTIAFLVAAKVFSPQYDLWLVPFLVMLPVGGRLVRHFYLSSFIVFTMSYGFSNVIPTTAFLYLNGAAVLYRLVVLLLIARDLCAGRSPPRHASPEKRVAEHTECRGPTTAGGTVVHMFGTRTRPHLVLAACVVALALFTAACSSSGKSGGGSNNATGTPTTAGKPVSGGSVVWALPAETSGGWCLPEAQLAISGIQVARAIYDPLTAPDAHEKYRPFLARSVTSNAAHTVWDITLRSGITFHDGTPLTAQVVKNNLDAARGTYKNRHPLLSSFVYGKYVSDVKVTGPLSVEVDTVPWTAFPAYLYGSGRFGIMAQAQLDDQTTCASKLIGTGPFMIKDWKRNDHLTAAKNPHYWRKDAHGVQLPYLDKIDFKPIVVSAQIVNGIESGDLDLALDDGPLDISEYRTFVKDSRINLTESAKYPELAYTLFNTTVPPFDNLDARRAYAYAVDLATVNRLRSKNITVVASGPFGPGVMGYLKNTGLPEYDPEKAKEAVAKYTRETGQPLKFTYLAPGTDPELLKTLTLIKSYLEKAGMEMTVKAVDESQGINNVIAKKFQAVGWRNHPGFDPDTEYVWWHCDNPSGVCNNPVNFGGFNDPVINKALEDGRSSADPAKRRAAYETVNRQFAKMYYNGWGSWVDWSVPAAKRVHGINNLPLPDGSGPFPGLTSGLDPAGVWVSG